MNMMTKKTLLHKKNALNIPEKVDHIYTQNMQLSP